MDIRYIDAPLIEGKVYVISILENFSRAMVASDIMPTQDLLAYLRVLRAAIHKHGSPEALVSDGGAVFKAKEAMAIYQALGIRKERIDKRQAWQSYIESNFNVQRRMADYYFAQAQTWTDLRAIHGRWFADYNYQAHWAHRDRTDDRHSPAEVLGWVHGTPRTTEELERVFRLRAGRRVDRFGYVRYRHWRMYAERGLSQQPAMVWLCAETLTIEYQDEPLSQFTVDFAPDNRHFRQVTTTRLFETRFASPQPFLWGFDAVEWHTVVRAPASAPRRKRSVLAVQPRLFPSLDD